MLITVEIEVTASRARVDAVFVLVPLKAPLDGVLAEDVLHASGKLDAVAVLERLQTKTTTDKVALHRTATTFDECQPQAVRRQGVPIIVLGRRKKYSRLSHRNNRTTTEHCETIDDERFIEFRDGVRALEVQSSGELADEVRIEGGVQTEGVVGTARLRFTTEARRVGAKTREAEQVAFLLREITEGREGEL